MSSTERTSESENIHQAFIQQHLPGWLKHASAKDLNRLHQSQVPHQGTPQEQADWFANAPPDLRETVLASQARSRRSRLVLAQALKNLQGLVEFAEPRLKAHLQTEFELGLSVDKAQLMPVYIKYYGRGQRVLVNGQPQSLLQAALLNFGDDVHFDPTSYLLRTPEAGEHLPLTPAAFATLCRELDLGGQYQGHLAAVYESPTTRAQVHALSIDAYKDQLRVDTHIALMRHRISGRTQDRLLTLLDGQPARCSQLSLFGVPLHDILLIAPQSRNDEPHPVVAYMPGVVGAPLEEFASLQALQTHLKTNLCMAEYRESFQRFVPRDQHDHFFSVLKRNLAADASQAEDTTWTLAPDADLHLRETPIEQELFGYLQDRHLARIKQEARALAVPTADADEKARQARLDYWESAGLNFLNVAAMFVPGLGEVMLAVVAVQLLKEVYDGVEAWEDGDIDTAMAHLKSVALNVAIIGGGVAIAKAASFLKKLDVVTLPNGSKRLWKADLAPDQSDVTLLDGVYEGLYLPALALDDSDRLALACLGRLDGWPGEVCLELRRGGPQGPLLERVGLASAPQRRVLVKSAEGYCAFEGSTPLQQLSATPADNDLFQAILAALPAAQRKALSLDLQASAQLKDRVLNVAERFRNEAPQWLWSGHTRGWPEQGRLLGGSDRPIGYPAAAPQAPSSLVRYRRLYPSATDAQAQATLDHWAVEGMLPNLELRALENQLGGVRRDLARWAGGDARRRMARDFIIEAWQCDSIRELADGSTSVQLNLDSLDLTTSDLDEFPQLQASFDHVRELSMDENRQLTELPHAFIRHFQNVERLSLCDCRVGRIPTGLNSEHLLLMDLSNNRITWDGNAQATLDGYRNLRTLGLSGNPLLTAPDLTALPGLEGVDLSECVLPELPTGLHTLRAPVLIDLSANVFTELPDDFLVPEAVGQALRLERNNFTAATRLRIEHYYASHRVDLLVAQTDYDALLEHAGDVQRAAWQRLRVAAPLQFIRDLRDVYQLGAYNVAPQATRRRVWRLLEWMDSSPAGQQRILAHPGSRIFELETEADVAHALAALAPREQTEQLLAVVVNRVRVDEVSFALDRLFPEASEESFEALRQWSLQQLARDPAIDLPQAPTIDEPVFTEAAERDIPLLTPAWLEQLRNHLLNLTGRSQEGLDAILALNHQDEYVHGYWVDRLRQRYAGRFAALRTDLDHRLEWSEQHMPEGDFIDEAARLRDEFEQHTTALTRYLTGTIADGTMNEW
ncbi:leucine-rich repeat domain-containing protein [Pseudomonas sp. LS1212]|uniref:leucine-rich repeat domain-containing protein n=1 Tax=Pseudomonas sp. LS1212 TaxID=2972478 RepID=UPI00215CF0FA|nr:leucine-rich repeat domain-containing protein [Pseudomonas sp. LS1212]UVJ42322.1 leucine-rich repeat domain-containing protein [Pseudomonas sp. LS1212]